MAQEVHEIIPEAVSRPEDETKELWALDYNKLVPVLVKAVQEQHQEIESLKTRIQALKKRQAGMRR